MESKCFFLFEELSNEPLKCGENLGNLYIFFIVKMVQILFCLSLVSRDLNEFCDQI